MANAPATGVLTNQAISSSTPFRYVFCVGPAGGYGNVAELEFDGFASPPMTPCGTRGGSRLSAGQPHLERRSRGGGILLSGGTGAGGSANCTVALSVIGHTYQLQSVDDLASGAWQAVPGVAAQSGNGGALQFNAPVKRRFYRIAITLQ